MKSSNFIALGAGAVLFIALIWFLLPDREGGETAETVAPEAVASGAVAPGAPGRDRLQQFSDARARGAGRAGSEGGTRVVPGRVAPSADTSATGGGPARPRPRGVGTTGEAGPQQGGALADPQPEDLPALKEMSLHDEDAQRRLAAVTLLGASDDPSVVPILSQALLDDNEDVRLAAVQALGDYPEELPVAAVEGALNDPSPNVRYEALELLGDVGGSAAQRAVKKALEDPDEDVKDLARSIKAGEVR